MREGWVEKRLKDVASVFAGQSAPQKKEDYSLTGTPFIKAGNLSELISGKTENSILKVTDFAVEKYGLKKYKSGSVLFAKSGMSCLKGYVYVTKCDCYVVSHLAIVQPKDKVNSYYLKYHFMYHKPYLLAKDTAYPSISIADILNYKILLPKIEKQEQIVSELDMITEMISKYDEQLKELDKLSLSIFYEMFGDPVENEKGWEVKTLKNISEKITSGNNAKLATGTYKSEGIPYFRCQNVWKNRIDFKDMVYIDEETNQKLKSSVLKHNDLLITKIGRINTENSSLGRVSIYKGEDFQANLSGNLCFIRLLDTVNPIFVLNIMISNYFRDYIRRTTVGGTDKRALKSPQIGRFPIILPPLALQQSFARKIEAIEAMKSKVREAKKEAETLLAARMQYWFE